jgi:hypothetical protein
MAAQLDPSLFFEPAPTSQEKLLYDKFIEEYQKDYDPFAACIRVGFSPTFAAEYCKIFMSKPYVQQQIALKKRETSRVKTEEEIRAEHKALVLATLTELIHTSPPAVRATAAKQLAQIQGFDQSGNREADELDKLVEAFKDVAKVLPE